MERLRIMTVFGTRPEAIKMAPLIKALEKESMVTNIICITAQHREMIDSVLDLFNIVSDYDLNIMKEDQSLTDITINALKGLEKIMVKESPDLVLVHGDTTTTFSASLAAFYKQIKIGHVEAGLRTYDKYQPFPEEANRKLTGGLADLHFAPTKLSKKNLLKESIDAKNIFVTGNTVIDCLRFTINDKHIFMEKLLNNIEYENKKIIVVTAHRRENIGKPLENICNAIYKIVEKNNDVEVVYLVHFNPNVRKIVNCILGNHKRVYILDPINIKDMHNLIKRSYLVMTDSGGLQEEVPSMGKPVLVLRNVTERPEGVEAGTLKLVGTNEDEIFSFTNNILNNRELYKKIACIKNPFGDGNASERIVDAIKYYFELSNKLPEEYIC